jgi:hypothetical protein
MFQYISSVYGNPLNAWGHEMSYHWYDKGGWLPTGASIAINNTGRPERVGGGAVQVVLEVHSTGGEEADHLARMIRKYVRVKGGGDVQVAFGS